MELRRGKKTKQESREEILIPVLDICDAKSSSDSLEEASDLLKINSSKICIDLPKKSKKKQKLAELQFPIEFFILSFLHRELRIFKQLIYSKYLQSYFLSFMEPELCWDLESFASKSNVDKQGSLQMLLQVFNETYTLNSKSFNHSNCQVSNALNSKGFNNLNFQCSTTSNCQFSSFCCSLVLSIFNKKICKGHFGEVSLNILSMVFVIFKISFQKYFFIRTISHENSLAHWIEIENGSFVLWVENGRIKLDERNSFLNNIFRNNRSGVIFMLNPNPFALSIANEKYQVQVKAKLKNWLLKLCKFESVKASLDLPTTVSGFSFHPMYVLENKIKKTEVLHPQAVPCGEFRGVRIFFRQDLSQIKSEIAWTRQGRRVKSGESPVLEKEYTPKVKKLANENGKAIHSMFAEWQTEDYVPQTAVNGIVPKNSFGNVEIFCEKMIPIGCTYLPLPDIEKAISDLPIDYAPACVGFKFAKGRASPRTWGIVVTSENADIVREAYAKYLEEERNRIEHSNRIEEAVQKKIKQKLEHLIDTFEKEKLEKESSDPIENKVGYDFHSYENL